MPTITLPGAVGEFAASRHGVLSKRQAASFGLKPSDLRQLVLHRVLQEVAPGVFLLPDSEPTWKREMMSATLCSREIGVAGYESAGALHVVDGCPPGPVVLALRAPRRILMDGVRTHVGPLEDIDVTEVEHIRCTTVERTICDIASVSTDFMAKMAFEWYWRTRQNLSSLQHTVDRLHRPGQSGTKIIQELLVEARLTGKPTESALEVRLEAIIGDIEGLVRQHEIFDSSGRFVGRVDFAIPQLRIGIEAHSKQHHSSPEAHQRDRKRHDDIVAADWRVRYITSKEMDDPCRLRNGVQRMINGLENPGFPTIPW
jgi:very-short-patch-repair endonuclease